MTGGTGTVTKALTNDLTTEGSETIIFEVRTGSTSGTIVATAATVTVADTSPFPGYTWTASTTDPLIAWVNPGNTAQRYFAIPSNGGETTTTNPWQYAPSPWTSWANFGTNGAYVAVTGGVNFNGTTYSGYWKSAAWTAGNPTYHQRVKSASGPLNTITYETSENVANTAGSAYTGPKS
jgi:hypothetical protein